MNCFSKGGMKGTVTVSQFSVIMMLADNLFGLCYLVASEEVAHLCCSFIIQECSSSSSVISSCTEFSSKNDFVVFVNTLS
jgi:hypothetical protein